jgi:hypothetical protein
MSDPRDFQRDPDMSRSRYVGRQAGTSDNSGWIIAGVIVVVLLGLAAYSYHESQMSASNTPETTTGQGMRAPVPNTPPSTPVAPAPKSQP